MARTKKADQTKNTDKTAKEVTPDPEKMEQEQTAAPEPEEKVEDQSVTQEPGGAEQGQHTSQEPETVRVSGVKTTEEEAAMLAEQVEAGNVAVLRMNENGEITLEEPDMFDHLPNPCVYCGPSVKGVARQYTTYQGGIPDALREFIKQHPEALGLIVSTGNFPAMHKRLETFGTPEEKLYKAVKRSL